MTHEPRRSGNDPFGRRALFWMPAEPGTGPTGRRAFFSDLVAEADDPVVENPAMARGAFTIACGSCEVSSRVGLLDLVIYQLPVSIFRPWGTHRHRLTCPACRRRAWVSISWFQTAQSPPTS